MIKGQIIRRQDVWALPEKRRGDARDDDSRGFVYTKQNNLADALRRWALDGTARIDENGHLVIST